MHTTNYTNTLILPAEDCGATQSTAPARPGTVADMQFSVLEAAPYAVTSDDLLVHVTASRRNVPVDEQDALRAELFSKGQPCLRASPLVKTLGWAVHHDADAQVALVPVGSDRFKTLVSDGAVTKVHGMRNKRA